MHYFAAACTHLRSIDPRTMAVLENSQLKKPLGERAKENKHTFHSRSVLGLSIGRTQPELEFEPVNSVYIWTKKTVQQVNAFAAEPDSLCLAPKPFMVVGEPAASSLLISTCVLWAHAWHGRCVHAHTHNQSK